MNLENSEANQSQKNSMFGDAFRTPTHYDILNIDQSASRITIRESYLRLKNLYSNNSEGLYGVASPEDLSRHLSNLDRAFDVLNDEAARATYNHKLAAASQVTQNANEWSSEADLWKPITNSIGSEIIQTSRSTLKVTRTRANGSNNLELQESFIKIMGEGDIADGAMLVALRELAGVTEAEIHERTKIALEYIRGMENNRFEPLPQVVYVKGFMRSYLRYLNVPNLEKIVSAYATRLEAWQSGQK